jgi:hypothetical protein
MRDKPDDRVTVKPDSDSTNGFFFVTTKIRMRTLPRNNEEIEEDEPINQSSTNHQPTSSHSHLVRDVGGISLSLPKLEDVFCCSVGQASASRGDSFRGHHQLRGVRFDVLERESKERRRLGRLFMSRAI